MEWLMRGERAVERVRERLLRTAKALGGAGVPYAVVGGNAVAIWVASRDEGAVRNTKDVHILLDRSTLPAATKAMQEAGFIREDVHGLTMFVDRDDPMPSRAVHVIFASEKVRAHYEHPAPPLANVTQGREGVAAIGLVDLLAMKLQAHRPIDQAHVADLVRVGLVTDEIAARLPSDLRARLEPIRANPNGEALS
jgi:hypothetical protein